MKRWWSPVMMAVILAAGVTQGAPTCFDFDCLAKGTSDLGVSAYLTKEYCSPVAAVFGEIGRDNGFGSDSYLWNRWSLLAPGQIAVTFVCQPVQCISFQGHIWDDTGACDFRVKAYDCVFDAIAGKAPVYSRTWNLPEGTTFESGPLSLPCPAYCLVFTNAGTHDIGIDNLCVSKCPCPVIPAPGALLLAGLGATMVGWLRTRRYV